jgi:hypothetical protein
LSGKINWVKKLRENSKSSFFRMAVLLKSLAGLKDGRVKVGSLLTPSLNKPLTVPKINYLIKRIRKEHITKELDSLDDISLKFLMECYESLYCITTLCLKGECKIEVLKFLLESLVFSSINKSVNYKKFKINILHIDQAQTIKRLKEFQYHIERSIRNYGSYCKKRKFRWFNRRLNYLRINQRFRKLQIASNFSRSLPILTDKTDFYEESIKRLSSEKGGHPSDTQFKPTLIYDLEIDIKEKEKLKNHILDLFRQCPDSNYRNAKRVRPSFNRNSCKEFNLEEGGAYEFFRRRLAAKGLKDKEITVDDWWNEVNLAANEPEYGVLEMYPLIINERGGKQRFLTKTQAPLTSILSRINNQCISILKSIPCFEGGFKLHSTTKDNLEFGFNSIIQRLGRPIPGTEYYESDCTNATDEIDPSYAREVIEILAEKLEWTFIEKRVALQSVSKNPSERVLITKDYNYRKFEIHPLRDTLKPTPTITPYPEYKYSEEEIQKQILTERIRLVEKEFLETRKYKSRTALIAVNLLEKISVFLQKNLHLSPENEIKNQMLIYDVQDIIDLTYNRVAKSGYFPKDTVSTFTIPKEPEHSRSNIEKPTDVILPNPDLHSEDGIPKETDLNLLDKIDLDLEPSISIKAPEHLQDIESSPIIDLPKSQESDSTDHTPDPSSEEIEILPNTNKEITDARNTIEQSIKLLEERIALDKANLRYKEEALLRISIKLTKGLIDIKYYDNIATMINNMIKLEDEIDNNLSSLSVCETLLKEPKYMKLLIGKRYIVKNKKDDWSTPPEVELENKEDIQQEEEFEEDEYIPKFTDEPTNFQVLLESGYYDPKALEALSELFPEDEPCVDKRQEDYENVYPNHWEPAPEYDKTHPFPHLFFTEELVTDINPVTPGGAPLLGLSRSGVPRNIRPTRELKVDKGGRTYLESRYPQLRGTQMGLRLSFVILCLLHSYAAKEAGILNTSTIYGDDIVAQASRAQQGLYIGNMKKIGFVMNEKKEHRSKSTFCFCGTYFNPQLSKTREKYPEFKMLLHPKTSNNIKDPMLRAKSINNSFISDCKENEITCASKLAKNKFKHEFNYASKYLPLYLPQTLGGFGLLPFTKRRTQESLELSMIFNEMRQLERKEFIATMNSTWRTAIFDKETREFEALLVRNLEDVIRKRPETKESMTVTEGKDIVVNKFKDLSQYWVSKGRSKLNYKEQSFQDCMKRKRKISHRLRSEYIEDDKAVSTLTTLKNNTYYKSELREIFVNPSCFEETMFKPSPDIVHYPIKGLIGPLSEVDNDLSEAIANLIHHEKKRNDEIFQNLSIKVEVSEPIHETVSTLTIPEEKVERFRPQLLSFKEHNKIIWLNTKRKKPYNELQSVEFYLTDKTSDLVRDMKYEHDVEEILYQFILKNRNETNKEVTDRLLTILNSSTQMIGSMYWVEPEREEGLKEIINDLNNFPFLS